MTIEITTGNGTIEWGPGADHAKTVSYTLMVGRTPRVTGATDGVAFAKDFASSGYEFETTFTKAELFWAGTGRYRVALSDLISDRGIDILANDGVFYASVISTSETGVSSELSPEVQWTQVAPVVVPETHAPPFALHVWE